MSYVPVIVPPEPSQRARELSHQLKETISRFRKEYPGTSSNDVAQALRLAAPESGAAGRAIVIAAALGVVFLGGLMFFFSSSGGMRIGNQEMVMIAMILIGIFGIAALFIVRR